MTADVSEGQVRTQIPTSDDPEYEIDYTWAGALNGICPFCASRLTAGEKSCECWHCGKPLQWDDKDERWRIRL